MSPAEDQEVKARVALFNTRASLYAESRTAELRQRIGHALGDNVALEHLIALQQLELVRAWMEGNLHGIIWQRERP